MFFKKFTEKKPFIIAEVGQNHQGDIKKALDYVNVFSNAGACAIKFQSRNNKYLFSDEAYKKVYNSENSFGTTYGEHREALELSKDELRLIKEACSKNGTYFMSTPFDEPSLEMLLSLNVEILKIASFDLGNIPFIKKIAQTKLPVVMSVGGGKINQIESSVNEILKSHNNLAVLHCVSEYPCDYNSLGLDNIEILKNKYNELTIGLSDHFNGILSGPLAYMKGARIFEKHVTFNRSLKGSDHSFSLEIEGFRKFTRDINRVEEMLKPRPDVKIGKEVVFQKLGKSITALYDLNKGEILTTNNITGKIFTKQIIPIRQCNEIIGKKVNKNIKKNSPISFDDIDLYI